MSHLAADLMNKGGRMIHITSIHGERVEYNASAYAIAPGFVDTPMSVVDGINELESEWFRKNYIEGHHLAFKRAAHPEEIAGVAYFLAGPDSSYITGQVITVDSGLTITF